MWRCSHRHLLEPQLCLSFCWLHQTVLVLKIPWPNSPNSFSATSMTASGLLPVQNWSTLLLTSIIPSIYLDYLRQIFSLSLSICLQHKRQTMDWCLLQTHWLPVIVTTPVENMLTDCIMAWFGNLPTALYLTWVDHNRDGCGPHNTTALPGGDRQCCSKLAIPIGPGTCHSDKSMFLQLICVLHKIPAAAVCLGIVELSGSLCKDSSYDQPIHSSS